MVVVVVVVVVIVVVLVVVVVVNYKSRLCDRSRSLAFCSNFVFSDTQNFRNKSVVFWLASATVAAGSSTLCALKLNSHSTSHSLFML